MNSSKSERDIAKFSGEVLEWFQFDRGIARYARKILGDIGEGLWYEKYSPPTLATFDDSLSKILQAIMEFVGVKEYTFYKNLESFNTVEGLNRFLRMTHRKILDVVESRCTGMAFTYITELKPEKYMQARSLLMAKFVNASAQQTLQLEQLLECGLMKANVSQGFPPDTNMEEKLEAMENVRHTLAMICPEGVRATYKYSDVRVLVRILTKHLNSAYRPDINRVLTEHKRKLRAEGTEVPECAGIDTYTNEYLPEYEVVRQEVVQTYHQIMASKGDTSGTIPLMITGDGGGRRSELQCYSCDEYGHRSGHESCSNPGGIGDSAPSGWKPGWYSKKKGKQKNGGSKSKGDVNQPTCRLWKRNGRCRFGDNCKYSHTTGPSSNPVKGMVNQVINTLARRCESSLKAQRKRSSEQESEGGGEEPDNQQTLVNMLMSAARQGKKKKGRINMTCHNVALGLLHQDGVVGIDTDASMFVSTNKQHFVPGMLKTDAVSVGNLTFSSAGAGVRKAVGVGPVAISTNQTSNGKPVFIIEPNGVLIDTEPGASEFTVFAQQRLKSLGLPLRQCHAGTDDDVLLCLRTKRTINLSTQGGIQVLKRGKRLATSITSIRNHQRLIADIADKKISPVVSASLKTYHSQGTGNKREASATVMATTPAKRECTKQVALKTASAPLDLGHNAAGIRSSEVPLTRSGSGLPQGTISRQFSPDFAALKATACAEVHPLLHMCASKLNAAERARLWHYRLAHPSPAIPVRMCTENLASEIQCTHHLNEDCPACDYGKLRTAAFRRRTEEHTDPYLQPWEKVYADGYGGQKSLGTTIGGANSGFIIVDAKSNAWWQQLKSSDTQLPAILRKFLLWVEMQHYRCRLIVVDTYAANISQEAEAVCAEFDCVIRPISAGTPQELGRAEKAVGELRRMTRASLASAPHLNPKQWWGLADAYNTWIHYILPGPDGKPSPYEVCEHRKPDLRQLFIKVWGCPVSFKPMSHTPGHSTNKNMPISTAGYFVGIQWPMVLVLRKQDHKVISVSRKKVRCYESMYVTPAMMSHMFKGLVSLQDEQQDIENGVMPKFVQSVKLHRPLGSEPDNEGENHVRVHDELDIAVPQTVAGMRRESERLKMGREVTLGDQVLTQMGKEGPKCLSRAETVKAQEKSPDTECGDATGDDSVGSIDDAAVGARVKTLTSRFDGAVEFDDDGEQLPPYSSNKPMYTYGRVEEIGKGEHEGEYLVLYDDGDVLWSEKPHLELCDTPEERAIDAIVMLAPVVSDPKPEIDPRSIFELLILDDWRDWIMAVKREMNGWEVNQVFENVKVKDIPADSRIIKLGELYCRKRTGKPKHRVVVFGNLLRKWVDYFFTTSYALTHDGFRFFYALSAVYKRPIKGADANCGYLQSKPLEKKPIYVYRPTHADYYSMSMEELAEFRAKLLEVHKEQGLRGIKKLAGEYMRQDRRKYAWKLVKAVYGVPGAGLSFQNKLENALEEKCDMKQSLVCPSFWYKRVLYTREQCVEDKVPMDYADRVAREFVLMVVSTDDFRYFGTPELQSEFERLLSQAMDVGFLDQAETSDYLAVTVKQDLERGTTEITQPKYWENAVERFSAYLPNGPRPKYTPIADGTELSKPTEAQIEKAKHLPYRQIVGVLQYAAAYTKPEMKYVMSILSQFNGGWSTQHFAVALRALEYGYTSRHRGIIYSGRDPRGVNLLYAYGDSSFKPPLSQGGRVTMCNGGAVSSTSSKHKKTNTSTAEAEAEEAFHASTDVVALRYLAREIGVEQLDPTIIYCDNQPAIQMMENKGSLAKRSKAMDTQLYALRDRMIDQEVQLQYVSTAAMVADIFTKPLGRKKFEEFREVITGYAYVKHPSS